LEINVWAYTIEGRDKITEIAVKTLERFRDNGVYIENTSLISFEEKGVLQPGTWKVLKNSKSIFRKLVRVKLS
jgi:hypothetical protein